MTRIRYKKAGALRLANVLIGHTAAEVSLNLATLSYIITDLETKAVMAGGQSKSVQMLKINAKKALKALGVQFTQEVRGKTKAFPTFDPEAKVEFAAEMNDESEVA